MGSKRVLVVDDEDAIREVVQAALEMVGGYDVITAGSGSEGFHTATAERPDAILLDVMMPDMDGISVFQKLQEAVQGPDDPGRAAFIASIRD